MQLKIIDVSLIIIFGALIYLFLENKNKKKHAEPVQKRTLIKRRKTFLDEDLSASEDLLAEPSCYSEEKTSNKYHPDYADVLAIINEYSSNTIFNIANRPVTKAVGDGTGKKDVWTFANKFIFDLSRKSGAELELIDINTVIKYLTEDQTKYQFNMVIQKNNPKPTKVKMILNVSCVTGEIYSNEDSFEQAVTSSIQPLPQLDKIDIIGFSTGSYDIQSERTTQYYAFNNLEDDEMMNPDEIARVVRKKQFANDAEMRSLTTLWDEDGRNYYIPDNVRNPIDDNEFPTVGTPMMDSY